jgi:hypothetical protein
VHPSAGRRELCLPGRGIRQHELKREKEEPFFLLLLFFRHALLQCLQKVNLALSCIWRMLVAVLS